MGGRNMSASSPRTGCGTPLHPPGPHYPTAVLLLRGAKGRSRVVWDVTAGMFPEAPEPPPEPPGEGRWHRSTAGKAKAPGETLRQRAGRHGTGGGGVDGGVPAGRLALG